MNKNKFIKMLKTSSEVTSILEASGVDILKLENALSLNNKATRIVLGAITGLAETTTRIQSYKSGLELAKEGLKHPRWDVPLADSRNSSRSNSD